MGGYVTVRRCVLRYAENAVWPDSHSIIQQNWIGEHVSPNPGPHHDGIQLDSGINIAILENYVQGRVQGGGSGVNAAVFVKTDFGGDVTNLTLRGNYLGGGTFTLYLEEKGGNVIRGTRVVGNTFGDDSLFGHTRVDAGTWDVWTGNRDLSGNDVSP